MADTPHTTGTGSTSTRRARHVNSFLVILLLTAAVWFVVSMSEYRNYPLHARVDMTGYDTDRYAVLRADSTVALQVQASGFAALALSLRRTPPILSVDMRADAVRRYQRPSHDGSAATLCRSVAVADICESLRQQLSRYGVRHTVSARDSLRLTLVARDSRTYRVTIDAVQVSFADGYGLYGEPSVSPSEVTLYGPREVLDRIQTLRVAPAAIAGLSASASHTLPIDPVWEQYGDLVPSSERVAIHIPVQPYVERSYTLQLSVAHADTSHRIRLYPDRATLRLWVARCDLSVVSASAFDLTVDYADIIAGRPHLTPRLSRFPEQVRIKSIEPSEIQYVIIK